MSVILGIDFGTTNSVASIYRRGKVETLLIEGSNTFPSVVSFKDKDTMLIGHAAKKRLIIDPEHSASSVKRFMGNRKKRFTIYGKTYKPTDISSFILKRIVTHAEESLNEQIKDVIITVPAYFNNNQKSDTLAAGKAAGLNVLQLIPEPTSAAIAYGLDKGKDQIILVYDLGGGTFDVSILKIQGNTFKVIAIDGDAHLGGDDFDGAIVFSLIDKFEEKSGINLKSNDSKEAFIVKQKIKEAAEKAKWELSEAQSTEIMIPEIMGSSLIETLTRDQYNSLIRPFLDTTIRKIRSVLKESGLDKSDIDRVILVGGSTRNVAVRELVTQEIKEPYVSEHVDIEVSRGAAILAASLYSPEEDFAPIKVENVTPHSLGLRISKGIKTGIFKKLIKRQTPIPVKVSESFTTYKDNQTSVEVAVFQGENRLCSQNTFVGGFILEGIPPRKSGIPKINIEFEMDSSDILQVYAKCEDLTGSIDLDINQTSEEAFTTSNAECIVLLVDLSYSMQGWKLKTTKNAVKQFLEIKKQNKWNEDLIGCVTFDSFAKIISPLTRDFNSILKKIEAIKVNGTTNMTQGLREAMHCLEENKYPTMKKRIIMLSDGQPDSIQKVHKIVDKLTKSNLRIDTIGAGKEYNSGLLQEIAKKTGGQFEAAENIQALIHAFINLAEI